MTRAELSRIVRSDLYRYTARRDTAALVKTYLTVPGFQYTAVMRACRALEAGGGRAAHVAALLILRRYERRWGISIPPETEIGEGLYIGHFGGIVVNGRARIGRNCNIAPGVTIGESQRGARAGVPVIGDRVWIGTGAKVVGAVTIGDDALIGPNAVVAEDVPARSVVVGPAPQSISESRGSEGYVNNLVD